MKPLFMNSNFILAALFALTACSANEKPQGIVTPVSASAILSGPGTPAEKSEELAKSAELLISAEGFEQASDLADKALAQDSTNFRARLIHELLAPLMLQKGLASRLRKIATSTPATSEAYKKTLQALKAEATSGNANGYLLTTAPEFPSAADAQKHVDATLDALDHLRRFLKENKDQEITLQVPSAFMQTFATRYAQACEIKTTASGEYELSCPPAATRRSVTLNRADFEAIQDMISFYLAYFSIPNAYDLSGIISAQSASQSDTDQKSQRLYARLMSDARFGRLRDAGALKRMRALGIDLIAGLRWAMANQSAICPLGTDSPQNRVGKFMNTGWCMQAMYYGPFVNTLAPYVSGKAEPATASSGSTVLHTEIYWASLLDNPLADLRQLGPLRFDNEGQLTSAGDPSLGGMFPKGDANTILSLPGATIQPH